MAQVILRPHQTQDYTRLHQTLEHYFSAHLNWLCQLAPALLITLGFVSVFTADYVIDMRLRHEPNFELFHQYFFKAHINLETNVWIRIGYLYTGCSRNLIY